MLAKVTDYWDEQVRAIDTASLELLESSADDRARAVSEISADVREHLRVLPDETLLQAACPVLDDLYKAACSTERWDEGLSAYLEASAGTFMAGLNDRGYRCQYLVDNQWEDMSKPRQLFPFWFRAAGMVYACAQVTAFDLMSRIPSTVRADEQNMPAGYINQARDMVNQLVTSCQQEGRHLVQLDVDYEEDSFAVALAQAGTAGVLTIFRNEAPDPGSKISIWYPHGQTPGRAETDPALPPNRLTDGESGEVPRDHEGQIAPDPEAQPVRDAGEGFVHETVFDSATYLDGVELERFGDPIGTDGPVALFLAGGPLTGKTSVLLYLVEKKDPMVPVDAVDVDPRGFREQIPEWHPLVDERPDIAAQAVYAECCRLGRELTERAVRGRRNLIIDGIGAGPPGHFAALLTRFHEIGYEVRVLFVDAPIPICQQRNVERAMRGGPYVDPEELEKLHHEAAKALLEWKDFAWLAMTVYSGE